LPTHEILNIIKKYIPFNIYTKIIKYCLWKNSYSTISWAQVKNQLDLCNLTSECADELLNILDNITPTEKNCYTFHINNNLESSTATEPTHSNTETLILEFMTFIYKRNIIASIVKYIILKDLIYKFTSSLLTTTHKGIFSQILCRLNQIIFESILFAFNGSNYDNYLLANPLILCLTKRKHKIQLFKKGNSISTIQCTIKKNIQAKSNKKTDCYFTSNLWIKDIRNMVSANMTLDQIGQLFNISFKKLCFPYNKAVTVEALKHIDSLHPYDELFWEDTFTGKPVHLEDRINAQKLFDKHNFENIYQFGNYYLMLDCLLLHSIVLTIFHTYLKDSGINIFLRRNFSQSNLAYQELFIVQPSRQIIQNLAPKKISHPFLNYFIKKGVTGGLCTSFVHNKIDAETIINSHFTYLDLKDVDKQTWPNFYPAEKLIFDKKSACIVALDIRSLYPSAACELVPVNSPLIYSRFIEKDYRQLPNFSPMLNLKSFCVNAQTQGNFQTDHFKLINKPPRFYNEFNAINWYLNELPKDITIIRFQSNFTALGQLYFVQYPIDGFLSYIQNNILNIKIIQYNSNFRHGHIKNCSVKNNEEQNLLSEKTDHITESIIKLYTHFIEHFKLINVKFEYVTINECMFPNHQIPHIKKYICDFKRKYSYTNFLQNILNNNLTGFIVVKNLEIKNKNPIIGFLIQKAYYGGEKLSPYTKNLLTNFNSSERVVSLHKTSSFMVISTHYFLWLYKNFGFQNTPDIFHGMFFNYEYYLKDQIKSRLEKRSELKDLIKKEVNIKVKQNLGIQSELIKLMLNSCYGFTLCNLNSSKFKCFKNAQARPTKKNSINKIKSCLQLAPHVYLNEYYTPVNEIFDCMLAHVGSNILFFSKIILLKRLYFVLKHLNPSKSQLLYMDTDSAHISIHHKDFLENIDLPLRENFKLLYNNNFENTKISGIWVNEGQYESGMYIGEKSYILYSSNHTLSHMKGLSKYFQTRFKTENIDKNVFPYIKYNIFQKTSDFVIFKTNMTKNLFSNYMPIKRYFVCPSGSLPLKLN